MAGRAEPKATCWRSLGCVWPTLETVPKGLFKKKFFFPILVTKFIHVEQSLEESMKN